MATTDAERIAALELDNARLRGGYDHLTKSQFTREDIRTMSAAEIVQAQKNGRLNDILSKPDPEAKPGYSNHSGLSGSAQGKDWANGPKRDGS